MKHFMNTLMVVLAIVFSVSTVNAGWGDKTEKIKFMTKDLTGNFDDVMDGIKNGKDVEIYGELTIPKNASETNVPCIIWMHGSAGLKLSSVQRIKPWLKMFNKMGVATFMISSFKPRGFTDTVGKQRAVSAGEMVVDVYKALEVMSNHPRIDKERIGIMGASKGGLVALISKWIPIKEAIGVKGTFALHISIYGIAMDTEPFVFTDAPLLVMVGEKDDYTPAAPWTPIVEKLQEQGQDANLIIYPNTYHSFDAPFLHKQLSGSRAHSYKKCRYKLFADGSYIETTTGKEGLEGSKACRCKATITIGATRSAKKDSKIKAAEFVTRVFKLN